MSECKWGTDRTITNVTSVTVPKLNAFHKKIEDKSSIVLVVTMKFFRQLAKKCFLVNNFSFISLHYSFFSLEFRFSAILFILEFDANSKRKINLNLKNNHCYSIHWTQTWFRNTVGYDYDYMMWCGILEHFNFNIFEKNYWCQMERILFFA